MKLVFDIESDGLLPTITKLHCISIIDLDLAVSEPVLYTGTEIQNAIEKIKDAELLIGHNISGFDIPAIEKLYNIKLSNKIFDTMTAAQLIFSNVLPGYYVDPETQVRINKRGHSLNAWGMRLNCYKSKIETDWSVYTEEMGLYCMQDTKVTHELYKYLVKQNWPQSSIDFEMEIAPIIASIGNNGIYFDTEKAQELYSQLLQKRQQLAEEARAVFPAWYKSKGEFVPKRNDLTKGYLVDVPMTKIELIHFNPGSRDHITNRLQNKYNWCPVEFTDKMHPVLNDKVLGNLPYPEAKGLAALMTLDKRLGQLYEGDQGWLRVVGDDHRIHGRINANGAATGRCSHYMPNLSQVPKKGKPYGEECRSLFMAAPGHVLIGCDFTGLEYATLAGYLKKYDGGRAIQILVNGDKDKGTDVHSLNAEAMGVDRERAKTALYAVMYGSGMLKTGSIINPTASKDEMMAIGRDIRDRLMDGMPGLKELLSDLRTAFRKRGTKIHEVDQKYPEYINGWVAGLDGRKISCMLEYKALNYLIQGAGALITKRGLVEFVRLMEKDGFKLSKEYKIVVYSHDEFQIEVKNDAEMIQKTKDIVLKACVLAGEYFKFPAPMSAEVHIGEKWSATH